MKKTLEEIQKLIEENQKRLAEILEIIKNDANDEADLDALEKETDDLTKDNEKLEEDKRSLLNKAEKRKTLLDSLSSKQGVSIDAFKKEEERSLEGVKMEEKINYRTTYFKQLKGATLTEAEQRAIVASDAVIPTETANEIIKKLEETSPLFALARVTYFKGNVEFPVEKATAEASWVQMDTASTDSDDEIGFVKLAAHKLIKTIDVGLDVKEMSISAFEAFVIESLSEKLAKAIDYAMINGTGSNQIQGILTQSTITQKTYTKTGMTYKDLMKIFAALPTGYTKKATLVCSGAFFYDQIAGMVDANGKPIVIANLQDPTKFAVLGHTIVLDDNVPAETLIYGNFDYFRVNFNKEIEVALDASVGFRTGSVCYRGLALVDGKPTLDEAFVVVKKATA